MPRQRWQAARFIGRLRDELLKETPFASLAHEREALMIWKNDYNHARPHGAIGNLAPSTELSANGFARASQPASGPVGCVLRLSQHVCLKLRAALSKGE